LTEAASVAAAVASLALFSDAVVGEDVLRVGQHVHQMRDGRALVARHIGNPGFEQGLGDGQNALSTEHLSARKPQLLDFFDERTLSHVGPCSLSWEDGHRLPHHASYNVYK
jgi:hypothetical protein